MRYIVNKMDRGETELILNYTELTPEVEAALLFMEKGQRKLTGKADGEVVVFSPEELLYVEKVDEKTFAYTMDQVIQLDLSLYSLEALLNQEKYFRCSKSMIVNIDKVERLKSLSSNRIDATLVNGEHIIISRTYASEFRRLLRGDRV